MADGFTLYGYGSSGGGWHAWARYARVTADDRCQMREIILTADQGVTRTRDSLLIPLSAKKAAELRGLIASGAAMDSEAFLEWNLLTAEDALDLTRMPVTGKIIDGDLQTTCLLLLTEENGQRFLNCVTYAPGGGYQVQESPALPQNATLDTFHSDDGALQVEFGRFQYSYVLMGDNRWHFSWAMLPESGFLSVERGLLRLSDPEDNWHFGELPDTDLFRDGVMALPDTFAETLALLNRERLAVVSNPDPADRLHLRAEPSRDATSLGKFYNGTIVQVLKEQGDWVQVRIGSTDMLTGWMMRKYLTFGDAMDAVAGAFPGMSLYEEHLGKLACTDARHTVPQTDMPPLDGSEIIIGAVDARGKLPAGFIIIDRWGNTGYIPQAWYWPGNG